MSARLAFTSFIVPWNAVAAEFSNDYVERTSIIAYRSMVGWTGGVAFSLFAWSYLFPNTEQYPAGQLNPESYSDFGRVVCCLVITWAPISSLGTGKEIKYLFFSFRQTIDEVGSLLQMN